MKSLVSFQHAALFSGVVTRYLGSGIKGPGSGSQPRDLSGITSSQRVGSESAVHGIRDQAVLDNDKTSIPKW